MAGFRNDNNNNDIMYADNVDFSGATIPSATVTVDGQLLIGSTATPHIQVGTLTSPDASVMIGYSSPNITLQVGGAATFVSITPYIVGQPGDTHAGFTTIQSAINQAVTDGASSANPKNIYVKPGTYTENLTDADGINIIGFSETFATGNTTSSIGSSVLLNGTVTHTTGSSSYRGINFSLSTGDIINISGGSILLSGCYSSHASGAFFVFTGAGTMNVFVQDCSLSTSGTGTFLSSDGGAATVLIETSRNILTYENNLNSIVAAGANYTIAHEYGHHVLSWLFNCNIFDYDVRFCQTSDNLTHPLITTGANVTLGQLTFTNCTVLNNGSTLFDLTLGSNIRYALRVCSLGNPLYQGTIIESPGVLNLGTTTFNDNDTNPQESQLILKTRVTGFRGSEFITMQGLVQTADATPTTIASVLLNELETITLQGQISGAQSDHTNAVGGNYLITARRASGGNITIVGASVTNVNSDTTATFGVSVDVGTQSVIVTVTGVLATAYNWDTTYSYQKILNNS